MSVGRDYRCRGHRRLLMFDEGTRRWYCPSCRATREALARAVATASKEKD